MAVFELVQANVPPAGLLIKLDAATNPVLHTTTLAGAVIVGFGFTVKVTVVHAEHPAGVVPQTV